MKSTFLQLLMLTTVSFTVLNNITGAYCLPMTFDNLSDETEPNQQQRRAISRFHDTLVYQQKNSIPKVPFSNKKPRSSTIDGTLMVLPADDNLRDRKYFSENVEERLGHIKLRQPRSNEHNSNAFPNGQMKHNQAQNPLAVPQSPPSFGGAFPQETPNQSQSTLMNEERLQDLQEVFRILARRNGPLLEQMLSLKDAIDRFYGIFEFMGVAKMPEPQRDAAIRKILDRSLNIDKENAAKRVLL